MSWLGVLPYIHQPYFEDCVATMHPDFEKNVLKIDNTKKNIGLISSWNRGVEEMYKRGADWLVHISAAIRFGKPGGMDFIDVLENHPDYYIIHAGTPNVEGGLQHDPKGANQKNGVMGWHLVGFHRTLFDNVGVFDQNYDPYNADDIDLSVRVQKFYKGKPGWDTFPVDVSDMGMAHGLKFAPGKIVTDVDAQKRYFRLKWGTDWADTNIDNYHDHPFNDPKNDLSYWPKPPNPLAIEHGYWT